MAEALKVNTAVTQVSLEKNSIGDAGCAALTEALKVNTAIAHVNLARNNIGDAGCAALAEALKVNTAVIHVNLENNNQHRRYTRRGIGRSLTTSLAMKAVQQRCWEKLEQNR